MAPKSETVCPKVTDFNHDKPFGLSTAKVNTTVELRDEFVELPQLAV